MSLADVLPAVEQLAQEDQLALLRILTEKLEPFKLPFPFQPTKIYYVYSPYDAYGAGKVLLEAKAKLQAKKE